MNRWRWGTGLFVTLVLIQQSAFAVCDSELEVAASSNPSYAENIKYTHAARLKNPSGSTTADVFLREIKINEDGISRGMSRRYIEGFGAEAGRGMVANHQYQLCMNKWSLNFIQNRSNNSSNASTSQQPQNNSQTSDQSQQNQSAQQQAEQDRLVTGPKEDCTLLLQQRPVVPADYIACLKRNVSRERNAASAGGGQSNDGAQQQSAQAQQRATQNQARADQARQGKRRQHEPENEASHSARLWGLVWRHEEHLQFQSLVHLLRLPPQRKFLAHRHELREAILWLRLSRPRPHQCCPHQRC
jgi:hypothetical protein